MEENVHLIKIDETEFLVKIIFNAPRIWECHVYKAVICTEGTLYLLGDSCELIPQETLDQAPELLQFNIVWRGC